MFPQIVAGPIVRYEDVQNEINSRKVNIYLLGEGAGIFIKGLAKKVLLANNIGLLWTEIKGMDYSEISVLTAWLGILAFTFQIYYDFSGYSDMAVGLGKCLVLIFRRIFVTRIFPEVFPNSGEDGILLWVHGFVLMCTYHLAVTERVNIKR